MVGGGGAHCTTSTGLAGLLRLCWGLAGLDGSVWARHERHGWPGQCTAVERGVQGVGRGMNLMERAGGCAVAVGGRPHGVGWDEVARLSIWWSHLTE